jgi:LysM repeat protein
MTSDTKIGLLLGLIFIFVIAFVINGLPGFDRAQGPNAPARDLAAYSDTSPDLGVRETGSQPPRYVENAYSPLHSDLSLRDQMALPSVDPAVQNQAILALNDMQQPQMFPLNPNLMQRTNSIKVAAWPKICEVQKNDNLARIAKRYYGTENGNKAVNIKKIFEANKDILPSQNALKVGQQLIIPALTPAAAKAVELEDITSPVKSVGTPTPVAPELWAGQKKATVEYTVKEEDSLWRIATRELGNGSRYLEIKDLNADTLPDEDSLKLGMTLILPKR